MVFRQRIVVLLGVVCEGVELCVIITRLELMCLLDSE